MDSTVIVETKKNAQEIVNDNLGNYESILGNFEKISNDIKNKLLTDCVLEGRVDSKLLEKNQYKCHGFAWFETYRISLVQTLKWYERLLESKKASELESLVLACAFSEYCMQMRDGIMMSQSEIIRPINDFNLSENDFEFL